MFLVLGGKEQQLYIENLNLTLYSVFYHVVFLTLSLSFGLLLMGQAKLSDPMLITVVLLLLFKLEYKEKLYDKF